jgi:tRNA-uridine 2-sulfurtransferase
MKIMVAMSGGVDSSVAAMLLKQQGHEVTGVTMCLGVKTEDEAKCCGLAAIEDARRVCDKLGIGHYVLDFSGQLESKVIDDFVKEYLKGRTPNPCVQCNKYLKFDQLLKKVIGLGFEGLATGHYAKIAKENGEWFLKKSKDLHKDQTYFLYCINKDDLSRIYFPLADHTKDEVRELAKQAQLPVANKPESQDICFVPDGDYPKFLKERIKDVPKGEIVDTAGKVLGRHKGLFNYTIGQRTGLGIAVGQPRYVVELDSKNNRLVVGGKEDLKSKGLEASQANWLVSEIPLELKAKIRYAHKSATCKISKKEESFNLIFDQPQESITLGQSVVLYHGDVVVGGGIIEKRL